MAAGSSSAVWVTSGRAVVVVGVDALALIDPGDEFSGTLIRPAGMLEDLLRLCRERAKPLGAVLITHAHPDHVANLALLSVAARHWDALAGFKVYAHAQSPLSPDVEIADERLLGDYGLRAIPTPGHSPWGDDLSFYHRESHILFSGDLIQPKGETWEDTFYPSPFPWFGDGETYLDSIAKLEALDFSTLVTGHREVRLGEAAHAWVSLTRRAIEAVREKVNSWRGSPVLAEAAPVIYRELARERNIDEETIRTRMTPLGSSSFDRYDLTGIRYWWERRFGES